MCVNVSLLVLGHSVSIDLKGNLSTLETPQIHKYDPILLILVVANEIKLALRLIHIHAFSRLQ